MLALGLEGGRVMLVEEATWEVKWAVQAHNRLGLIRDCRTKVAMAPDGRFVASLGSGDELWKLWDAASGSLHRVGAAHDGTGACTCEVNELGMGVLQEGCPVVAHDGSLRVLAFSPCGQRRRLATGGEDGAVILWDAATGAAEHRMQSDAWSLSFSADGARLASGNAGGSIRVWDAREGALLRTIPAAHINLVVSVCFSPTEIRMLASGGPDYTIHLWDVDSGEKIRSIAGRWCVEFSPDGRSIATASAGPRRCDVHMVDTEPGESLVRMVGHVQLVNSLTLSVDDGSTLASGSYDGTCKVWDSSTGALLLTINVGAPVSSVSFGRDWVRDTQCAMAFAMGQHPRLGAGSQVLELEVGVVRMVLDRM